MLPILASSILWCTYSHMARFHQNNNEKTYTCPRVLVWHGCDIIGNIIGDIIMNWGQNPNILGTCEAPNFVTLALQTCN